MQRGVNNVPDAPCLQYGWNVVTAATANSQLAGVLAGFVFAGIIFLFGRSGLRNIQALTLLSSAFVVLAFDSYLYGLVVGGADDTKCSRVWSESMPAGGMLALGGAAVVTALCRLAAEYADQDQEKLGISFKRAADHLHGMSRLLVYGVTVAVSLLLVSASNEYLAVSFENKVPTWLSISIFLVPAAVGTAVGVLEVHQRRQKGQAGEAPSFSLSLSIVSYALVIYTVLGSTVAGVLTVLPDDQWSLPLRPWVLIVGLLFGLVLPGVLLVVLTLAAPRRLAEESAGKVNVPPPRSPRGHARGSVEPQIPNAERRVENDNA
jgi:hypothetical protein